MRTGSGWVALLMISSAYVAGCGDPRSASEAQTEAAIIGGTTDTGDPSVVALFAHQPGAQNGALCTASVIAPTVLLTAAHCVDPAEVGQGAVFEVLPVANLQTQVTPLAVS